MTINDHYSAGYIHEGVAQPHVSLIPDKKQRRSGNNDWLHLLLCSFVLLSGRIFGWKTRSQKWDGGTFCTV